MKKQLYTQAALCQHIDRIKLAALLSFIVLCSSFITISSFELMAYETRFIPGTPVSDDFVVNPAKLEVALLPGETETIAFHVMNRTGRDRTFSLSLEDFEGSRLSNETVTLLDDKAGERGLSRYLTLEEETFSLAHGEQARVEAFLTAPAGEEPGGRYAGIFVAMEGDAPVQSGASVVARIGVLVFATIEGEIVHNGKLTSIQTRNSKKIFWKPTIPLQLLYENLGTSHVNPYGRVVLKNMFGATSTVAELDPWFVLPGALRTREVVLEKSNMFGRYTAEAEVNRGYDDIIDEASVSFYVLPAREIAIAAALAFAVFILRQRRKRRTLS